MKHYDELWQTSNVRHERYHSINEIVSIFLSQISLNQFTSALCNTYLTNFQTKYFSGTNLIKLNNKIMKNL